MSQGYYIFIALTFNLILVNASLVAKANLWSQGMTPEEQRQIAQQNIPFSRDFSSFFETGRMRSQDRLLFQSPPREVMPVAKQSNSWQFIIFKEGGFSFWMPPGILTEEKVVLDTTIGKLSFRTLASNTEDRRYVIGYAASLTPEQAENPEILLNAIRERAVPSGEFKLQEDRSITLDNYPGRELTFENDDEVIIIRAYLGEQRVYVLGVRYPKANPQPRQTRAFLNALELLNRD